ncbi:esterase/lipase family protein [Thermomonospora umbrina]|uniref:Alpha/beta hydrolase family protein n=1 Tax=Thermomonospora umbrina TaxID=111806 RepID=A0A3D9SPA5_9ACTN|nr:alpha/beta fold hydrolase [Thermomonospora umbrina]REE97738.1 alpha/beta hydrolase family protein [Thermomonospora umbrina]
MPRRLSALTCTSLAALTLALTSPSPALAAPAAAVHDLTAPSDAPDRATTLHDATTTGATVPTTPTAAAHGTTVSDAPDRATTLHDATTTGATVPTAPTAAVHGTTVPSDEALYGAGATVPDGAAPAAAVAPSSGFNDWGCRPSAEHPEPVLLLHGLGGNGPGNFLTLGRWLERAGYCVYAPTYGMPLPFIPVGGLVSIDQSAREIGGVIDKVLDATGAERLDVVGHSEGGFQALYVPKFVPGYASKIDDVVALAPPTHGTNFANLVTIAQRLGIMPQVNTILALFGCKACTELTTGAATVARLTTGPIAQPGITYTVIASKTDTLVTPTDTSFVREPGVTDLYVQDVCPSDRVGHIALAYHAGVAQMIGNALDPSGARPVTC